MAGRQILNAIHTDQRIILTNAASLTGSTALTSLLGFIYWWAAARTFPPTEVGFASAAISAMTFLGTFGVLGMGTYLMGILPCTSGSPSRILRTSLLFVSISGTLAGALFLVSIPVFFPQMSRLIAAPLSALLWAAGAGVTSVSLTLDDALIGLLQGRVQLMRSAVFAFSKLLLLFTFAAASWNTDGGWIITAWISGALISLLAVKLWFHPGSEVLCSHPPQHPRILPGFRYALQHHALNLALLLPGSLFPLMITTRLSAAHNAYFYAAWMIAAATFVPASALTTVLFHVGVRNTARIKTELRLTIKLSLLLGCMSCLALLFLSDPLLSFFGSAYAREAAACLRILGLAVFPVALRLHFVALSRIHGQVGQAALVVTAGALLELVCGMLGVHYAGLPGLAWAWLLALLLQSGPMLYFSLFKLAR